MARVSAERDIDEPFTDIGKGVVRLDPYLEPFKDALKRRYAKAQSWIKVINEHEGGLEKFSRVIRLVFRSKYQVLTLLAGL